MRDLNIIIITRPINIAKQSSKSLSFIKLREVNKISEMN